MFALGRAAAAAGVSLDDLVTRLETTVRETLDAPTLSGAVADAVLVFLRRFARLGYYSVRRGPGSVGVVVGHGACARVVTRADCQAAPAVRHLGHVRTAPAAEESPVAQRDARVEARRAARGEESRRQRDRAEQHERAGEARRIRPRHAVQHAA